jgi:anti-sigma regulatory factor (Ser/Thr protein kinase)
VRTWGGSGEFVCEIADRGGGVPDPLAGRLPPSVGHELGLGLWLAHQLCDRFYLWPRPTTVRLQMDRHQRVAPVTGCGL